VSVSQNDEASGHPRHSKVRVWFSKLAFEAGGFGSWSAEREATRKNGKVATTCGLSGSQTDPVGDVFTISGSVGAALI
jgi:hypothetical protein